MTPCRTPGCATARPIRHDIANLRGWLTTVVARVCLNRLRGRRQHPEDSLEAHLPEPIISDPGGLDPEEEALLGDAVGMAMLIVLDQLTPAERVAFVLHDVFAVPFEEVAPIVDRTPAATRQLASRARRRIRGSARPTERDLDRQRAVVDAFLALHAGRFPGAARGPRSGRRRARRRGCAGPERRPRCAVARRWPSAPSASAAWPAARVRP